MVQDSVFGPRPLADPDTLAGRLQRGKGECAREVLISGSCPPLYRVLCGTDFEDRRDLPEYFGRILAAIDGDAVALIEEADRIHADLDPSQDNLEVSGGRRVDLLVQTVVQAALRGHVRSQQALRFGFASTGVWAAVLGEFVYLEGRGEVGRELLGRWPEERIGPGVARFGRYLESWAAWDPRLARALEQPSPTPTDCGEDCDCEREEEPLSRSDAFALAATEGFVTNVRAAVTVLEALEALGGCRDEASTSLVRRMALEHGSPRVRNYAGSILGRAVDEGLRSPLLRRLGGEDSGYSDDALGGYVNGLPTEMAVDLARRIRCTPGSLGKTAIAVLARTPHPDDYSWMRTELAYAMEQGFDHRHLVILRAWPSFGGRSDDPLLREVYDKAGWLGARYEAYAQMRPSLTDVWRDTCTDALWDASEGIRRLACSAFRDMRCPVPERLAEIAADPFGREKERSEAWEALRAQTRG